ncbi:MAG: hypothetical protein ACYCU5_16045 [Actinomycetes bacterium]
MVLMAWWLVGTFCCGLVVGNWWQSPPVLAVRTGFAIGSRNGSGEREQDAYRLIGSFVRVAAVIRENAARRGLEPQEERAVRSFVKAVVGQKGKGTS